MQEGSVPLWPRLLQPQAKSRYLLRFVGYIPDLLARASSVLAGTWGFWCHSSRLSCREVLMLLWSMVRTWACLALLACSCLVTVSGQDRDLRLSSARRKALVIGNAAYTDVPPLRNPVNDATDLAAALREVGFLVTMALDADAETMERVIQSFVGSIGPGDVALFHFSGHGFQSANSNYLAPVDLSRMDEIGARHGSYLVAEVHERLVLAGAAWIILTLDACRNNRFGTARSGVGGLAPMAVGAEGSYVAFATSPGGIADENPSGRHGRFSEALIRTLEVPGLELDQFFKSVRNDVFRSTDGRQTPWSSSSVRGDFYFNLDGTIPQSGSSLTVESGAHVAIGDRLSASLVTDYVGGVRFDFVEIPAGQFEMGGSPGDSDCDLGEHPHHVRISKGFQIQATELTQGQWEAVFGPGSDPSYFDGIDLPVESVSWDDIQRYLRRINRIAADHYNYRLPTESEWEYAARAGTGGRRYGDIDDVAWYAANSGTSKIEAAETLYQRDRAAYRRQLRHNGNQPHAVRSKRPNPWGLYGMLGGVWEWCHDIYEQTYYRTSPESDPQGPVVGHDRVLRGGSWLTVASSVRVSNRLRSDPARRENSFGFRIVRQRE